MVTILPLWPLPITRSISQSLTLDFSSTIPGRLSMLTWFFDVAMSSQILAARLISLALKLQKGKQFNSLLFCLPRYVCKGSRGLSAYFRDTQLSGYLCRTPLFSNFIFYQRDYFNCYFTYLHAIFTPVTIQHLSLFKTITSLVCIAL